MALDLSARDEVIVPSFTFPATATAAARTGARVRFADIDPLTLSVTPETVEPLLSRRTKAIITVHYAGIADRPDELAALSHRHRAALIEDNAHGLGGSWKGTPLGRFAPLAAMSFHESKNLSCGEGGALGINDPTLTERCEIAREKGTDRSRFFRGEIQRYTWVGPGSSFLPSDMLAAMLVAQLDQFGTTQRARQRAWHAYDEGLGPWAELNGFATPFVPAGADHPAHIFYLLAPDREGRANLSQHLAERDIEAPFHYQPLHLSKGGVLASRAAGDKCPVSADVAERLLRLPLYADIQPEAVSRVIQAVTEFRRGA